MEHFHKNTNCCKYCGRLVSSASYNRNDPSSCPLQRADDQSQWLQISPTWLVIKSKINTKLFDIKIREVYDSMVLCDGELFAIWWGGSFLGFTSLRRAAVQVAARMQNLVTDPVKYIQLADQKRHSVHHSRALFVWVLSFILFSKRCLSKRLNNTNHAIKN
jgi:hypothetical protein